MNITWPIRPWGWDGCSRSRWLPRSLAARRPCWRMWRRRSRATPAYFYPWPRMCAELCRTAWTAPGCRPRSPPPASCSLSQCSRLNLNRILKKCSHFMSNQVQNKGYPCSWTIWSRASCPPGWTRKLRRASTAACTLHPHHPHHPRQRPLAPWPKRPARSRSCPGEDPCAGTLNSNGRPCSICTWWRSLRAPARLWSRSCPPPLREINRIWVCFILVSFERKQKRYLFAAQELHLNFIADYSGGRVQARWIVYWISKFAPFLEKIEQQSIKSKNQICYTRRTKKAYFSHGHWFRYSDFLDFEYVRYLYDFLVLERI